MNHFSLIRFPQKVTPKAASAMVLSLLAFVLLPTMQCFGIHGILRQLLLLNLIGLNNTFSLQIPLPCHLCCLCHFVGVACLPDIVFQLELRLLQGLHFSRQSCLCACLFQVLCF